MKSDFSLSLEDIKSKNENALELFYSGIKSAQTRRSMEGNLKTFLVTACAEIFSGDYRQRVQEFVDLAKEDQDKATSIVLAYVRKLRERASLDRSNPDYLNPSSIPNKIKPIRKLLDMNGFGLGWKRIYSLYPEKDNTNKGRLTTELVEDMRRAFAQSEQFLCTDLNVDSVQDKKQLLLEMWKEQATLYGIDPLKIKIEKQRNDGLVPVENKIEAIKIAIQESMKEKESERYDSQLVDEDDLVLYVKKGWDVVKELSSGRILIRKLV